MTSTSARAVSLTTRRERTLPLRKLTPARLLLSFKTAASLFREALMAGARPNKIPVSRNAKGEQKHMQIDRDRRSIFADVRDAPGIDG
jgi:hypothetical protein